jgi:predicted HicB family RNase H-like nuclease
MARRTINPADPRELAVQISIRIPFWYREQLLTEAQGQHVSLPALVTDALERVYKPQPPK